MFEHEIHVGNNYFYLKIIGYKGENLHEKSFYKALEEISKITGVYIVVIDPDVLPSPLNLIIAAKYALRAFIEKRNISEKFPIELLLFLSGKKEINKVLEIFPPKGEIRAFVICLIGKNKSSVVEAINLLEDRLRIRKEISIFDLNNTKIKKILKIYNINEKEVKSYYSNNINKILTYAVAIRSALLALKT